MEKSDLVNTFDAQIWAQEWLKTVEKNSSIATDEGTMIAWFATAIMAGYDHAYREVEHNNPLMMNRHILAAVRWFRSLKIKFNRSSQSGIRV